jgi:hypothetical protein
MRIIIAAAVGGLVMFIWGAVSHMLLPLGEMGIRELPNEPAVRDALGLNVPEAGLYVFPGAGMTTDEAAALPPGPTGFLAYRPDGTWEMSGATLGAEFAENVLAALLVAIVLSRTLGSVAARGGMAMLIGLAGWLSISASYWTWYGFPTEFTIGEGIGQAIGWLLTGLAIAAMVPGPKRV